MMDDDANTIENEILELQYHVRKLTYIHTFVASLIIVTSVVIIGAVSYFAAAFRIVPSDVDRRVQSLSVLVAKQNQEHEDFESTLNRLIQRVDIHIDQKTNDK